MKFGLLVHSPTNNLGDHVQSLAARRFLPRVDCLVEREELHASADAGPLKVIMNGWWMHRPENWPPPPNIVPLFVSFHVTTGAAREAILRERSLEYLRKHAPIGCRDASTLHLLRGAGVDAYYSGCLTMTFPRRQRSRSGHVLFVDPCRNHFFNALPTAPGGPGQVARDRLSQHRRGGGGANLRPEALASLAGMPEAWHRDALRISALTANDTPDEDKMAMAEALLEQLAAAKIVVTSRLHALLPAMAMGVPCLFVLKDEAPGGTADTFLSDKGHDCTRHDPRLGGLIDHVRRMTFSRLLAGCSPDEWSSLAGESPAHDAELVAALEARVAAFVAWPT